jgi:hypothetical protein
MFPLGVTQGISLRLILQSTFNNGASSLISPEFSNPPVSISNSGGSIVSNKLTMASSISRLRYLGSGLDSISASSGERFTISLKIKTADFTTEKVCWIIQNQSNPSFVLYLSLLTNGKLRLTRAGGGVVLTSNTVLNLNQEYTVLVDINYAEANTSRIQIDGITDVSALAGAALMSTGGKDIYLGGSPDAAGFASGPAVGAFLNGTIDDFEIYRK